VPRLAKLLRVPTPADRGRGQPWRPGTSPPARVVADTPGADIRIGYARCSPLGQELDSQLDALTAHGIPRDKIFSEKISTRVRVRPQFEGALRTAREIKAHAPHSRVIFTVYEMKRLGRAAAELAPPTAEHRQPPSGGLLHGGSGGTRDDAVRGPVSLPADQYRRGPWSIQPRTQPSHCPQRCVAGEPGGR
jgi:hypothetical protein